MANEIGPVMQRYFAAVYAGQPPALACPVDSVAAWRDWRAALTAQLTALLGGFPERRGPVPVIHRETVETATYTRELITYESEPGVPVPAYLCMPRGLAPGERRPAVLCLHGHGRGKDDVLGLAATPRERQRRIRSLGYDYGHQLAERGYVVIAPDGRGFGELASGGMTCQWAMTASLLLGKVLVGGRVFDAMRAIDLVQSLPMVDPDRIGCIGFSWGGTQTMYTAALDDRVQAAVISGAFGTFKDALIDEPECPCQYVPNLLRYAELADIVALIAPRPLLIESGADDPHYTREIVEQEYARLAQVYRLLGHQERVALDLFPGNHRFHGDAAFAWLDHWL